MLPLYLSLLRVTASLAADVPLHSFEDVSVWAPNPDGGHAPQVSADTQIAHTGAAMRIRYRNVPPDWGNLTGPCQVPGNARALRLWVYKHSAAPKAAMHIWLFEPDGDGWVQQVRFDGKKLTDIAPGWHEARLPVAAFAFEPRGTKTPQMTAVNRMLIGCNFGDLEVTVDDMTWETGPSGHELPLPRTPGLTVERRERGNIAILDMGDGLPADFTSAHPPAALAEAVRAGGVGAAVVGPGGFGATILKAGDFADPAILTPDNFDAVILPYGPHFPLAAREAFLAYLKAGGSFLSTDGYAFDSLDVLTESGWSLLGPERTADQMDKPSQTPPPLNTRTGKPGDAMTFEPDQIPIFDPQFRLEHATSFRLAGWYANPAAATEGFVQDEVRRQLPQYDFDAPVTGFSACGLIGLNSPVFPDVYRRWVPVLEAYAASPSPPGRGAGGTVPPSPPGRGGGGEGTSLRGTALAIMRNYAGPFRGSSWAFSGLTSQTDLFLGDEKRRGLLMRVLCDITDKVYLHDLTTDLACYEPGETAHISVKVSNFGRRPATRTLHLWVGDGTILERDLRLEPGETQTVDASQPVSEWVGYYDGCIPCGATLIQGREFAERIVDKLDSAFCIRDEKVLASGPQVGWSGNYLTVDGRPTFLVGSNQTGMMYYSAHENPAIWDRDFRSMAEHNFHILRILHFSPFSRGGYEGHPTNHPLDLAERPLRLVRQMDAIVQLAQRHRVAIFLSLHDWMGVELTDEELAAQADWNHFWAERYRDVPGIFYDIQNEPGVGTPDRPDIVALWNQFLMARYGSDDALAAAWTKHPPEAALPNVPLGSPSNDWHDVRAADLKRFQAELLNRWIKANLEGLKAGDPDALVCVGYLPWMAPADKILGTRLTDFSNMHYYGPVDGFATELALIDRRFAGKGLSLGECGAQEAHDARIGGADTVPVAESVQRFQAYLHYGAALGAAFICNWDWKDFDEMVFPWGLMRHGSNIPKPWLHTWEQGSLLLSLAELQYESPQVFILVPDSHRIGPHFDELHNAIKRCIDLLLDQRVNFAMLNEEDLSPQPPSLRGKGEQAILPRAPGGGAGPGGIPASARAILWPLPYCPDDETFDRVLQWVKAGGALYLSGDIAFDRTRKPTRAARREALGLPAAEPRSPFDTPQEAWRQPPLETSVGNGKVLFVPYPLELHPQPTDEAIYRRFLALAGIAPIPVEPVEAPVRVLSLATRDGGRLFTLARTTAGSDLLPVRLPGPVDVGVQLQGKGFAFVLTGPRGELRAVESQGDITIGQAHLTTAPGHYALCALDGRDLRQSQQVLVLPHQSPQVDVSGLPLVTQARCWVGFPGQVDDGDTEPLSDTTLSFPPGTLGQVALLARPGEMAAARATLRAMLALRFTR